jgi:hypothetical protein
MASKKKPEATADGTPPPSAPPAMGQPMMQPGMISRR